jgi:transcriptional regulator with XRE-family HTH domain
VEEGDGHTGGFAEAIRAWRQRRGWTQEELSHASGLSTRAIRSLERGRTLQPRRTTVQMLADALEVPRARLMVMVRRAVAEEAEDSVDDSVGDRDAATGSARPTAGSGADVPRELPPDLGDPGLDVRVVVAELMAVPTTLYRATVVRADASEVAIRAAHHTSVKFPDGQLYANLAGTPPMAPAIVLRRFLRSLDVLDRPAQATTDELAAAYRSALAGRRMLVVLDGVQSEAQVRPLIPAEARCALLVVFAAGKDPDRHDSAALGSLTWRHPVERVDASNKLR